MLRKKKSVWINAAEQAISPSGKITAGNGGNDPVKMLRIWDVEFNGRSKERDPIKGWQVLSRVSADGRKVVSVHSDGYRVWTFDGPEPTSTLVPQTKESDIPLLLSDGKIVVRCFDGLFLADPAKPGTLAPLAIDRTARVYASPVGAIAAVSEKVGDAHELSLWDFSATTPVKVARFPVTGLRFDHIDFSPDGSLILAVINGKESTLFARKGDQLVELAKETGDCWFQFDGTIRKYERDTISLHAWTGTKTEALSTTYLKRDKATLTSFAYSGDRKTVIVSYSDGLVRILDVATGKDRSPPQQWDGRTSLQLAADGKHVFAKNPNGTVYVLRLSSTPAAQ